MARITISYAGTVLERLALLPEPGPDPARTAAILLGGVDVAVVATPVAPPAAACGRLAARARQRGIPAGTAPVRAARRLARASIGDCRPGRDARR